MEPDQIINYILSRDEGIVRMQKYAEETFFYNPKKLLPHGVYFVTIKVQDGPNDKSSELDRKDVFRLSFKPYAESYALAFGEKPSRPAKGRAINFPGDFTELNRLMPHPIYAWMGWVCILNPSTEMFDEVVKPLLDESLELVRVKFSKKL